MAEKKEKYIIKETIIKLQCQKCLHIWKPQNPDKFPHKCPRCNTYEWRGEDEE